MELSQILEILRRRLWLILSLVLVTAVVLGVRARIQERTYESVVQLQITVPQEGDVAIYDTNGSSNPRDQITVTRNNFAEVLEGSEVATRTIKELRLAGQDSNYTVSVSPLRDSDFVYVTVAARTPELAEQIANTHVRLGIAYYGEMRAKPAAALKAYLGDQLKTAGQQLSSAEESYTKFQLKNGLAGLNDQASGYQSEIQQLRVERARRELEGPTSPTIQDTQTLVNALRVERERAFADGANDRVARLDTAITKYSAELDKLRENTSPTAYLDRVIADRQSQLDQMTALAPQDALLQQDIQQAKNNYQLLLNKYSEANLKEQTVRLASFIQVVEPASQPTEPAPTKVKTLLILGIAASLGLGILLALLLEYMRRLPLTSLRTPAQ